MLRISLCCSMRLVPCHYAMNRVACDLSVLTGFRWDAMKAVSWLEDGERKFWSESHVSEDFDMSLRLQTHG